MGIHTLVLFAGQVLRDKAILRVCAGRVLDHRIHVHREAVTDSTDLDVLLKRVVVAVLGQEANVPLPVSHLVLARSIISYVSVADVLNVPDHAVEDFGDLNVSVVVNRNDLGRRPVLPLVVGHLTNVLRQLVDRQARACVDRLTLHRASSRQHIGGPLPVVVGTACVELEVVNLVLAGLRQRRHRHVQPAAGSR